MNAQAVVASRASVGFGTPPRYLHAVVAVARSAYPHEWSVVHLGSGKFLRTDRLGASTIRAMIDGRSDLEATAAADRIERGAGDRATQLLEGLASAGALTLTPPALGSSRWRSRRLAALAVGLLLGFAGRLVRLAPVGVLAGLFRWLPGSPVTAHVWRSGQSGIQANLRAAGYMDRPPRWLKWAGLGCAAVAPVNHLFMYLGPVLQPARLAGLVKQLVEPDSFDRVARQVDEAGAVVGVMLHSGCFALVPNALRERGLQLIRAVAPEWHGVYLSHRSGPLGDFWGDRPETAVKVTDPLATAAMVRHLKAGRSIYIALDRLAFERPTATTDMLGLAFPRNDGPAWLAVRSGRPVSLWTTHYSPGGVTLNASPLVYPDSSLPPDARVADVSERLYRLAELAIRAHPESWAGWTYLSLVTNSAPPTTISAGTR